MSYPYAWRQYWYRCYLFHKYKAEITIQEIENPVPLISQEETKCMGSHNLWTMYFHGANSKDRLGARLFFISLDKNISRYLFTLNFTCTNNITEYEALYLD